MSPAHAWTNLMSGNQRFVQDIRQHPDQDPSRRLALTDGQEPFALVFGCSDSRVPAELVFDQGLGSLFVVRTAGHVADSVCLGSIEYGVEVLKIPLVVVLGHQGCGAVAATVESYESGETPGGFVRDVVERITPSVFRAARQGELNAAQIVPQHVISTVNRLAERSITVKNGVEAGTLAIVGAVYDLAHGVVEPIHALGAVKRL